MKKSILLLILAISQISCNYFKSDFNMDLVPYSQKDKYGYFDMDGKIIINPQFAFATPFNDDLALVKTTGDNGKFGYINKEGKFVINAEYISATIFSENKAIVVKENGAPTAINKSGKVLFSLNDVDKLCVFKDDLAAFSIVDSTDTKWGFVDDEGKKVINAQFSEVKNFKDGKCAVKNNDGKWGYIDKEGKIIVNYQFDYANDFIDGKAVVLLDDKAGVIDNDGKYIINPQFQSIEIDDENYLISQDDKYGWCDSEGKIKINPQFDQASLFNTNDNASVKSGENYGYIDKDGKFTINPQFQLALNFVDDKALVMSGDKYGIIDKDGKYIVNPQFEGIPYDVLIQTYFNGRYNTQVFSKVETDYLDVNSILKVVNINNPENLSFNDNFQTILNKVKKNVNDFSTFSDIHSIFEEKKINNEVSYNFAVMGKLKDYDSYSYGYIVTKEKPTGFLYGISLSGKASGKSEILQKAFEKKLSGYSLMKKGYIDNVYTSVYKNEKNIIVTNSKNTSQVLFYILNHNYDISYYLDKITEKQNQVSSYESNHIEDNTSYDSYDVDSSAAVVDSSAAYYEGE